MLPKFARFKIAFRRQSVNTAVGLLLLCTAPFAGIAEAAENGGLGPLSVRNQFPPALPYLNFLPERPKTLPQDGLRLSYQYAVTNTFINTQSPENNTTPVIDRNQVDQGLDASNFPASGYAAYIDVETTRHQISLRYGLFESLELGLDLAWVSFSGGGLDSAIESFESSVGALNEDRTHSDRDRFDYYLIRDGTFLVATSESAALLPQDPVFNVKWNWSEGGEILPMITLKLSYKMPLDSNPGNPRALVSSGRADHGYYLLVAKQIGTVVGHLQFGRSILDIEGDDYSTSLEHKLFGLEFRTDEQNSWLLQVTTQSSLFRSGNFLTQPGDFLISRPTDVLTLGHRFQGDTFGFDVGMVEDFNQNQNETDIILFLEMHWQW